MRKFVMPMLAAAFLAIAGTAATPQTANASSVHVGIHGPGWGVHFNDGGYRHQRRHFREHRQRGPRFRAAKRFRHNCAPVYRTQWHMTHRGWKRMKVHVGYDCAPRRRWR